MGIRMTDSMRYDTAVRNIFTANARYTETTTKLASQKEINKISDDPLGVSQVLSLKQALNDTNLYTKSIENLEAWVTFTESQLNKAIDLVVRAKELAVSQGSATADAASRKAAAAEVKSLFDELLSIGNEKLGSRYLFGGTRTDSRPFSGTASKARIDDPIAGTNNTYQGSVSKGGTFTGDENKTYTVKIVQGGSEDVATYRWSDNGGRTWSAESIPGDLKNEINLAEGVKLTFSAGTFGENDIFYVQAYAAGYYNGNGEALTKAIGKNSRMEYGVTGAEAFTAQGGGDVDIFSVLADLKQSLEDNNTTAITDQLEKLDRAADQLNVAVAKCGARANRLEIGKNILSDLNTNITNLISYTEDADMVKLTATLSLQETALQACYLTAARMQNMTIMNFFK